jgi:hypothetical protein
MRIFVLCFALSFASLTVAQIRGSENESQVLSYKISLYKIDRKTKSLAVKIRLKNTSKRNVIIDKKAVRYEVIFEKKGEHLPDGGVGPSVARVITVHPSLYYRGDFILLRPGDVYETHRTLYFDDNFFEESREFTLSLTYGFFLDEIVDGVAVWKGTITSNQINFKH